MSAAGRTVALVGDAGGSRSGTVRASHGRVRTRHELMDYLVATAQKPARYRDAKCLGGPIVDDQLEPRRKHDRRLGRCFPSAQKSIGTDNKHTTKPVSRRPCRIAATGTANDAPLSSPTSGIFGCCARAASGQAAAVLPSPAINSRRRIGHPSRFMGYRPSLNGNEPSVRSAMTRFRRQPLVRTAPHSAHGRGCYRSCSGGRRAAFDRPAAGCRGHPASMVRQPKVAEG